MLNDLKIHQKSANIFIENPRPLKNIPFFNHYIFLVQEFGAHVLQRSSCSNPGIRHNLRGRSRILALFCGCSNLTWCSSNYSKIQRLRESCYLLSDDFQNFSIFLFFSELFPKSRKVDRRIERYRN